MEKKYEYNFTHTVIHGVIIVIVLPPILSPTYSWWAEFIG